MLKLDLHPRQQSLNLVGFKSFALYILTVHSHLTAYLGPHSGDHVKPLLLKAQFWSKLVGITTILFCNRFGFGIYLSKRFGIYCVSRINSMNFNSKW
jgi:hypothetical protein